MRAQGHTQGGGSCLPGWCPCYCLAQGVCKSSSWTQGKQARPRSQGADGPFRVWLLNSLGGAPPWSGVLGLLWGVTDSHSSECDLPQLYQGPGSSQDLAGPQGHHRSHTASLRPLPLAWPLPLTLGPPWPACPFQSLPWGSAPSNRLGGSSIVSFWFGVL